MPACRGYSVHTNIMRLNQPLSPCQLPLKIRAYLTPLAAFENKRSFLSIENLCFVISELLERNDIPSGVYNVADNEALSTNELIRLIAAASDRKPLLWKISSGLIRSLAKLGDALKLPL